MVETEIDGVTYLQMGAIFVPIHEVSQSMIDEALDTARKRRDYHAGFGPSTHWIDESKGEYDDESLGSLGQIAFEQRARQLGHEDGFESSPLFTENVEDMPPWDARLYGTSIEIKSIPPDSDGVERKRLLVRVSGFKRMDAYVAVKFLSDTRYVFCGWVTGKDVADSPVKNRGFANAHELFLKSMKPLRGDWWTCERQPFNSVCEW